MRFTFQPSPVNFTDTITFSPAPARRKFLPSSLTLASFGGWIFLGLLTWLLVQTHDTTAAPATLTTTTTVCAAEPAADWGTHVSARSRTERRAAHRAFWRTRLVNRQVALGGSATTPRHDTHTRTEKLRASHTSPTRAAYLRNHPEADHSLLPVRTFFRHLLGK